MFIHYFTGKVLILIFFVIDPDGFFCLVIGPAYPIPFLLPGCVPNVAEVYDPMKKIAFGGKRNKNFPGAPGGIKNLRKTSLKRIEQVDPVNVGWKLGCPLTGQERIRIKTWGKSCDLLIRTYYIIYIYTPSAPQSYRGFYGKWHSFWGGQNLSFSWSWGLMVYKMTLGPYNLGCFTPLQWHFHIVYIGIPGAKNASPV